MKRAGYIIKTGIFILSILIFSCTATTVKETDTSGSLKKGEKYNFKFICYDRDITDPGNDRRSYYRIFIDKSESGRTTTGLESQEKIYEERLTGSRHLIVFEKWVLDEKEGRYIKLNNIDQPKPNHKYFTIPENGILIMVVQTDKNGKAEFSEDYE